MRSFINVEAASLPEAYQQLYLRLGEEGKWGLKESYAVGKKFDKILECESRVAVSNVLQEPIVSLAFPGLKDLPTYVGDVLLGTKDYIIGAGYDYTYHDRIFHRVGGPGGQIAYVIRKLKETTFSNRAQITTWVPEVDSRIEGPPCFQRGWFKVEDETLHFETDWRSREFVYAWYENIIAMAGLAMLVRDCLRDYAGLRVSDGISYVDKCNSLHVYERDHDDFERTLSTLKRRNGAVDAWNSTDSKSVAMFEGKNLFSAVNEAKKSIFDPVFKREQNLKSLETPFRST
jgi:thymidylate synthase